MNRLRNDDLLSGRVAAPKRGPRAAPAAMQALVPEDQETVRAFERSAFPRLQLDPAPRAMLAIVESLTGRAVDLALLDAIERARLYTGWSGRTLTEIESQGRELQEGRAVVELPSPTLGAGLPLARPRPRPNWRESIAKIDPTDLGSG